MRAISRSLGGLGGMLPEEKFSCFRFSGINLIYLRLSMNACNHLYIIASSFPLTARGVVKSRSQRRQSRTGESVHRLDDRNH